MDHNQILLDAVIEFPPQFLVENTDGLQESSLLLSPANQLPISNQNMVEMGKKLLEAASENNLEAVRALMTGGAPFTGNWLGTTPLHAAAKAGHIETVEVLLKAGIFRDAKTKVDRTALQMAAEEGYTAIVQMLLEHGADVNSKDMLRMTALHWAVERGHRDVVNILLLHGADASILNKFDKTAMDIACDNGFQDIALQLETASFQKSCKPLSSNENGKAKSASPTSIQNTSLVKSPTWKNSPEEDALEKLTASARNSEPASHEALKLLESHGISFLPVDNSTLLTSALESGQSIGLTEAGKMALNQMKKDVHPITKPDQQLPSPKKLKISPTRPGHPRVVTITAEQLLSLAGRLQQGKGNGKPMIISLPKSLTLSQQSNPTNGKTSMPAITEKVPAPHLDSSLPEFVLSEEISDPTNTVLNQVVKPYQATLSMPLLTDEVPCSETTSMNTPNDPFPGSISSGFEFISTGEMTVQSIETIEDNQVVVDASLCVENGTSSAKKSHFLKSGQLKGSARTTPMALLCRRKRTKSASFEREKSLEKEMLTMHSRPTHQPTLNNAAPPLDADDEMFVNEESDSCHTSNPPVWLSIMEEENSQFSAGATENDDDLLDPNRLAAQLASIRQAASQYSFSS